jgi:hypothetical protein
MKVSDVKTAKLNVDNLQTPKAETLNNPVKVEAK